MSAGLCTHDHARYQHQVRDHYYECQDHFWNHDKCQDLFYDHQDWWLDYDRSSHECVRQPIRWQANLRQPVLRFGGSIARYPVSAFEPGGQGKRCCQNRLVRVAVS